MTITSNIVSKYGLLTLLAVLLALPCSSVKGASPRISGVLKAAFVCVDGVFNSELVAPYDVLQHSVFRDRENYIECFIVTPDGKPFRTFEGINIEAHYSFATAPDVDILIIPSTETSMTDDLKNEVYLDWVRRTVKSARYVVTVCDGAFPLAATGVLDGRSATTFPSDRARLQEMFPKIDVRDDVRLVVDGKFITSVGGGMSYEPAFYLVEHLYSKDHAERTARGLVWDWNLDSVPRLIKP